MPGQVVKRVAKGKLGMWTEVHFPNGDRVMVSMTQAGIEVLRLKRKIALFGTETLASVDTKALAAFAATSGVRTRDELVGTRSFTKEQAEDLLVSDFERNFEASTVLDTITALVCRRDGAEDIRNSDLPHIVALAGQRPPGE